MDENTVLLQEIDQTTKTILANLVKPTGGIGVVMDKLAYALTVFGIVGGLYSFVIFVLEFIGG
jgi:hypothetical protein